jgi:hypothetical protein
MPLSHDHKSLFIHIPKTGGISWRNMLGISEDSVINETDTMVIHGRDGRSHDYPRVFEKMHFLMKHIIQLRLINKEIVESYFKFAFVRNPWDKLLSAYSQRYHEYFSDFELFINKIRVPVEYINNNFVFDINNYFYEDYNRILYNTLHNNDINKPYEPKFDDYEQTSTNTLINSDYDYFVFFIPSFIPQHLYICNESNDLLVNFVGKFENYVKDTASVLEYLNIDTDVKKMNSSVHLPYKEMYNNKTRDIVAKLYSVDIEMFGYEF